MQQKYAQLITGLLIGAALVLIVGRLSYYPAPLPQQPGVHNPVVNASKAQVGLPQKVYTVLAYIRTRHQAMEGYEGGRIFTNREGIVPREDGKGHPVSYQEWDVNPKIRGQNRGAERILTGSDGRAWYTNDHYQSFTEIKP